MPSGFRGQTSFSAFVNKEFQTNDAAPLLRDGEIFGVYSVTAAELKINDANSLKLLEAVSERRAASLPVSMAFERSCPTL